MQDKNGRLRDIFATGDQWHLQGCIYGLIALGFVLIYKGTETVSFAQGDLMMLGAFAGLACMTMLDFPFWLAVLCAVTGMGLFGFLIERVVIRPILGQPAFTIVMLTIGIGYVARGAITMIPVIGTETHTMPVPYKDQIWRLGTLVLNVEQMVVIAVTAVLCGALYALFRYSKIGIAMQASSQNQLAAYYMGIPVKRINGLVWALATAVAAVAGCCWHRSPLSTPTWVSSASRLSRLRWWAVLAVCPAPSSAD
jgi:branched-chain amino acid transport system permease protein